MITIMIMVSRMDGNSVTDVGRDGIYYLPLSGGNSLSCLMTPCQPSSVPTGLMNWVLVTRRTNSFFSCENWNYDSICR